MDEILSQDDIKVWLKEAIDEYPKAALEKGLFPKALKFFSKNKTLIISEGLNYAAIEKKIAKKNKRFPKELIIEIAMIPFLSKKLYTAWRSAFDPKFLKLWDKVLFEDSLFKDEIEAILGKEIIRNNKSSFYYNLTEALSATEITVFLISIPGGYWVTNFYDLNISLPLGLRVVLRRYYKRPKKAIISLLPLEESLNTAYIYDNADSTLFSEISRLYLYAQQGEIPLTNKDRPKHTSIGKMNRILNLKEFFSPDEKDKKLKNLRTNMLAALIVFCHKKNNMDWVSFVKDELIIKSMCQICHTPAILLNDLKGMGYLDEDSFDRIEPIFFGYFENIAKTLPKEKLHAWISFESIYYNILYNFLPMKPIYPYSADEKLRYVYKDSDSTHSREESHYIHLRRYKESISIPYIKATIFMYAAVGLMDIAYDRPDRTVVGRTCHSAYDELKFFRLTKFGAYIFGRIKKYKYEKPQNQEISFSSEALTLSIPKDNVALAHSLKSYIRPLGPNRFATDSKIFLSGIRTKKQLQQKINLFKEITSSKLPPNWEAFF
ncbi:MAG TPA: hypothetical protein ENJ45_04780, partial [Phaeodactylibacter sp.]|nr:hypothetical protein [Phaeodactylibacter sp.]